MAFPAHSSRMPLTVLPPRVSQHYFKVVSQVLLIGVLTLFWLHLVFRGWQQAGRVNQVDAAAATAVIPTAVQPSKDRSSSSTARSTAAGALEKAEDAPVRAAKTMLQISEALFLKRSNGPLRTEPYLHSVQMSEALFFRKRSKGPLRTEPYLHSVKVAREPLASSRRLSTTARTLVGCQSSDDDDRDCRYADRGGGGGDGGGIAARGSAARRSPGRRGRGDGGDGGVAAQERAAREGGGGGGGGRRRDDGGGGGGDSGGGDGGGGDGGGGGGGDGIAAKRRSTRAGGGSSSSGSGSSSRSGSSSNGSIEGSDDRREGRKRRRSGGIRGKGEGKGCRESLSSALEGVCRFNHIALSEAPGVSAFLLLETVPWVVPDPSFFSHVARAEKGEPGDNANMSPLAALYLLQYVGDAESERLKYIAPTLRSMASSLNQVDEALHDFVSAKVCSRLSDLDLLQHPAVQAELKKSPLSKRCASRSWYEGIIRKNAQDTKHCRLFHPLPVPPPT